MKELHPRITSDPKVCGGDPCVAGTRIPVHIVLSHLAGGDSLETILDNFPTLKREDISACLEFAAALCTEKAMTG
jgi:uncharacterized protein (DUF433 family)